MKKIAIYLLAFILAMGMTGCSTQNQPASEQVSPASDNSQQTFSIGEIASNESIEFTLDNVDSADVLGNVMNEKFLLPSGAKYGDNPYVANEGNTMISLSYHIKNTGKTDLNLQNMYFEIVYGDGYRFKSDDLSEYHYLKNENWENYAPDCYTILPLNNREYRACIEVPAEVFENTDAPLKFELHTSSETVFTYNIR